MYSCTPLQEIIVNYIVSLKGIRRYCGKLFDAYAFIEGEWGSCDAAWDIGVKIVPAVDPRSLR